MYIGDSGEKDGSSFLIGHHNRAKVFFFFSPSKHEWRDDLIYTKGFIEKSD